MINSTDTIQGKKPWDFESPEIDFQEKCFRCGHIRLDHVFSEGPCSRKDGCEKKCKKFAAPGCKHEDQEMNSECTFLEDTEYWMVEIKIKCKKCGIAFKFMGLPAGLDYEKPTINVLGTTIHLPVHPVGEEPPPLPLNGPKGFSVKKRP